MTLPGPTDGIDDAMASIRRAVAGGAASDPAPPSPPAGAPAGPAPAAGTSIEAFVAGLLEPLLKAWLDAHLPEIVERATHAEIRRLTGLTDPGPPAP